MLGHKAKYVRIIARRLAEHYLAVTIVLAK
jgi:hypothetical protein